MFEIEVYFLRKTSDGFQQGCVVKLCHLCPPVFEVKNGGAILTEEECLVLLDAVHRHVVHGQKVVMDLLTMTDVQSTEGGKS